MKLSDIVKSTAYQSIVNDYRDTCLWFAGDVRHPKDILQIEQVLSAIEANGDLAAYRRVAEIRKWQ